MPILSWPPLVHRQRLPELMDQPGLDPDEHARALVGLRRINAVSRSAACLFDPISALARALPPHAAPLQLLDVACGGGDVALDLAALAQRHGLALAVTAWGPSRPPSLSPMFWPIPSPIVLTSLFRRFFCTTLRRPMPKPCWPASPPAPASCS